MVRLLFSFRSVPFRFVLLAADHCVRSSSKWKGVAAKVRGGSKEAAASECGGARRWSKPVGGEEKGDESSACFIKCSTMGPLFRTHIHT